MKDPSSVSVCIEWSDCSSWKFHRPCSNWTNWRIHHPGQRNTTKGRLDREEFIEKTVFFLLSANLFSIVRDCFILFLPISSIHCIDKTTKARNQCFLLVLLSSPVVWIKSRPKRMYFRMSGISKCRSCTRGKSATKSFLYVFRRECWYVQTCTDSLVLEFKS